MPARISPFHKTCLLLGDEEEEEAEPSVLLSGCVFVPKTKDLCARFQTAFQCSCVESPLCLPAAPAAFLAQSVKEGGEGWYTQWCLPLLSFSAVHCRSLDCVLFLPRRCGREDR